MCLQPSSTDSAWSEIHSDWGSSKCPKRSPIGEGNMHSGGSIVPPAMCEHLVPVFLIWEEGRGLSELAGLGLNQAKLFPPKPWGAARGPYEEKQPPLWLTHGSGLQESCLIAIQPIFTLLSPAVSRTELFSLLIPRKGELLKSFPKPRWTLSSTSESCLLFTVPFICPYK